MIAARLVAAPSPAAARKAARQDFGATEILSVERARRRQDVGELVLWRVSFVELCAHCGGNHDVVDEQCPVVLRPQLAAELEPRGAILL